MRGFESTYLFELLRLDAEEEEEAGGVAIILGATEDMTVSIPEDSWWSFSLSLLFFKIFDSNRSYLNVRMLQIK